MISFTIYDNTTGQILRSGWVSAEDQLSIQAVEENEVVVAEEANEHTEYYPSGVKTARPLLTTANSWNKTTFTANGTDSAVFGSSLPNPTYITIIGPLGVPNVYDETNTDTSITIKSTFKGDYEVTIKGFPYQDYTTTLTAE